MVNEALDFKYLLIDNYKRMKISEHELATILVIDHLLNEGNSFVSGDLLSLKMSLDPKEIDMILANLFTKGFLEIATIRGKTTTSLKPLKKRLMHEFKLSLAQSDQNEFEKEVIDEYQSILGRRLSPVEISEIREWFLSGNDGETIINALKESISNGHKSLNSVHDVLLKWATRDDRESEGHSSISKEWDKDLEETMRIAKTPWINNDED